MNYLFKNFSYKQKGTFKPVFFFLLLSFTIVSTFSHFDTFATSFYNIGLDESLMHSYLAEDESTNDEIKSVVNYFVQTYIRQDMSDFEKEMQIIKYLVDTVNFDKDELDSNSYKINDSYRAYGALINGRAVCSGYAKAFDLLAKSCGLSTTIVTGQAVNSRNFNSPHAWNQIYLDGDWYNVDVTWEDPITNVDLGFNSLFNKFINRTDLEFAIDHIRETGHICTGTKYGAHVVASYLYTGVIDLNASLDALRRNMLIEIKNVLKESRLMPENATCFDEKIKSIAKNLAMLGAKLDDNSNFLPIDNQIVNAYILNNIYMGEDVMAFVTLPNSKNMLDIDNSGWLQNNITIPMNISMQNFYSSDGIFDTRILVFNIDPSV